MKIALVITAALLWHYFFTSNAIAERRETLSYGGRAGMDATIVAKWGIGTEKAVIKLTITREDAAELCSNYILDESEKCIRDVQKDQSAKLKPTVTANCKKHTWQDMYGEKFVLRGRSKNFILGDGVSLDEFVIEHLETGEILGSNMASGYYVQIYLYEALCPNFRKILSKQTKTKASQRDRVVIIDDQLKLSPTNRQLPSSSSKKKIPLETDYISGDNEDLSAVGKKVDLPKPGTKPKLSTEMSNVKTLIEEPSGNSSANSKASLPDEVPLQNITSKNQSSKPFIQGLSGDQGIDPPYTSGGDAVGMNLSDSKGFASRNNLRDGAALPYENRGIKIPSASNTTSSTSGEISLEQRVAALESKLANSVSPNHSDLVICKTALSSSGLQWESEPEFKSVVDEALKRSLTIEKCRITLGYPSTPASPK
jgi:hypothetical protein